MEDFVGHVSNCYQTEYFELTFLESTHYEYCLEKLMAIIYCSVRQLLILPYLSLYSILVIMFGYYASAFVTLQPL